MQVDGVCLRLQPEMFFGKRMTAICKEKGTEKQGNIPSVAVHVALLPNVWILKGNNLSNVGAVQPSAYTRSAIGSQTETDPGCASGAQSSRDEDVRNKDTCYGSPIHVAGGATQGDK
jgi:hypothetical protein